MSVTEGECVEFLHWSESRRCGAATLRHQEGSTAEGVLYHIPQDKIVALDKREGHPGHYERTTITVTFQGESMEAVTYRSKRPLSCEAAPNDEYFRILAQGARRFLSPSYRDELIKHMRDLMG